MATATVVNLTLALGAPNGPRKTITATASDVNAAYVVFPDSSTATTLSSRDVYLVDFISGSASGDCSLFEVFVGGTSTNTKILKAASGPTAVMRPIQSAPVRVAGGASIAIKQLT